MRNIWIFNFIIGCLIRLCMSGGYMRVKEGQLPYMIYFRSRYRGTCNGFMVARNVAMTAAVCVTDPINPLSDLRALNIVAGSTYRHQRQGIKIQVTKILIPEFPSIGNKKDYYMQKAPAVLLLRRKVPDILVQVPVRALAVDFLGNVSLNLQDQCIIPGWHFFGKGDKIYANFKFLLQKHLSVQFVNIVKSSLWCESLTIQFQKALDSMGFEGQFDPGAYVCVADPDGSAQACHGMYGAPLLCQGRAIGMLMALDAQWRSCNGFSNVIHLFNSQYLVNFMQCVSGLFAPDPQPDWTLLQTQLYDEPEPAYYDYVQNLYDQLTFVQGDEYY